MCEVTSSKATFLQNVTKICQFAQKLLKGIDIWM
jgi:hypothetical protein